MPSKTPKQARLMAAVAHGWKPDRFKGPSQAVAKEFNQADKGSGILARHAAGGMVKPPGGYAKPPVLGHTQSPLGQAIQNKGNAGRYGGGMGLAPARPPRVPVLGMMRNIDQGLTHKKIQLKALGGQVASQPQPPQQAANPQEPDHVHQVVMTALKHLEGMDASSAAAVLRSSPEAMAHPEIAAVENALRSASGITPATKQLNQISQAAPASSAQPMQTLLPPLQSPGGAPAQGGAQPSPSPGMQSPGAPGSAGTAPSQPPTNRMSGPQT